MSSIPLFIRYPSGGKGVTGAQGAQGAIGSGGNAGGAGFFIWLNLWDTTPIPPTPPNPLTSPGPYLANTISTLSGTNPAILDLPNSSINNSLIFELTSQNTFKLVGGGQWKLTLYGFSNNPGVFFSVTDIKNFSTGQSLLGVYSEITEMSTTLGRSINVVNGSIKSNSPTNVWQINQGNKIRITFTFYDANGSAPPLSQLHLYFQDQAAYSNFVISTEVLITGPTGAQGATGPQSATPNLSAILMTGNNAGTTGINMNNNDIININNITNTVPSGEINLITTSGNSQINSLQITNLFLQTACPDPSPTETNGKLATLRWVKTYLSFTGTPTIRRASSVGNFTTANGDNQTFVIDLTGSGYPPLIPPNTSYWQQNQGVTFRINYFQSYNPRTITPFDNQNFISFTCVLTLYPYRFNAPNWLASGGGSGNEPNSIVTDNSINSNSNFDYYNTSLIPYGRQWWASDINFQTNAVSVPAGKLYVYGGSTVTTPQTLNRVTFELSKPDGYTAQPQAYSYNFSIELLNQSSNQSIITSSPGFNVSNF